VFRKRGCQSVETIECTVTEIKAIGLAIFALTNLLLRLQAQLP
jgi:hypothetical protein